MLGQWKSHLLFQVKSSEYGNLIFRTLFLSFLLLNSCNQNYIDIGHVFMTGKNVWFDWNSFLILTQNILQFVPLWLDR